MNDKKIIITRYSSGLIKECYEITLQDGLQIKDGSYDSWFENRNKKSEGEYLVS